MFSFILVSFNSPGRWHSGSLERLHGFFGIWSVEYSQLSVFSLNLCLEGKTTTEYYFWGLLIARAVGNQTIVSAHSPITTESSLQT